MYVWLCGKSSKNTTWKERVGGSKGRLPMENIWPLTMKPGRHQMSHFFSTHCHDCPATGPRHAPVSHTQNRACRHICNKVCACQTAKSGAWPIHTRIDKSVHAHRTKPRHLSDCKWGLTYETGWGNTGTFTTFQPKSPWFTMKPAGDKVSQHWPSSGD